MRRGHLPFLRVGFPDQSGGSRPTEKNGRAEISALPGEREVSIESSGAPALALPTPHPTDPRTGIRLRFRLTLVEATAAARPPLARAGAVELDGELADPPADLGADLVVAAVMNAAIQTGERCFLCQIA